MKISEQIKDDLKQAMKNGETEKRDTLRMLQSMIKNEEIEKMSREEGLTDDETLTLIKRAVKQRQDSIEQYKNAGREDLAKKENLELEIISQYLPKQMNDADLEKIVTETIEELQVNSKKDMGKVMGAVIKKAGFQADGQRIKEMVMKNLI